MKRITISIFISTVFIATSAFAAQLSLTTVVPAPGGHVASQQFVPTNTEPVDCTAAEHKGYMYFNSTTNRVMFCTDAGWKSVDTMWERDGTNNIIYPEDLDDSLSLGTNSALFRITAISTAATDSGILTFSPDVGGRTLPAATEGAGTKFMWYPAKSAFRAGTVTGTEWDDANIASHSSALGVDNQVTLSYSGIGSGQGNTVGSANPPDTHSFIGGGANNSIRQGQAFIGGGTGNIIGNAAGGYASVIGGGRDNVIASMGIYGVIVGGQENQAGTFDFIGGGYQNVVNSGLVGTGSTIVGGSNNVIDNTVAGAFIGGGNNNNAKAISTFVGGGTGNSANLLGSLVVGGSTNTASGDYAIVVGGERNVASGNYSFIGGGGGPDSGAPQEENIASGLSATIGGGYGNTASGVRSTIAGGINNTVSSNFSIVGGGWGNQANGSDWATVAGGVNNTASGQYSFVGGGGEFNLASGTGSVVPGGTGNEAAGNYSFAAGEHVHIQAAGNNTFAWGKGTLGSPINVAQSDSFIIATGNVGIGNVAPQRKVQITGALRLEPLSEPPPDAVLGDIYVQGSGILCFFDGGNWVNLLDPAGDRGLPTCPLPVGP